MYEELRKRDWENKRLFTIIVRIAVLCRPYTLRASIGEYNEPYVCLCYRKVQKIMGPYRKDVVWEWAEQKKKKKKWTVVRQRNETYIQTEKKKPERNKRDAKQ